MKVHYIACARSCSVDGKTNQLSLFHILDEISATAFPLLLPSFCVAALFEREPEDAIEQSYVLAVKLDGGLVASFTMSIDFTTARRNRSVNMIQGLTIPASGTVSVSMVQKGRVLAEWLALALQINPPGLQAAPLPPPAPHDEQKPGPKSAAALN